MFKHIFNYFFLKSMHLTVNQAFNIILIKIYKFNRKFDLNFQK